MLHFNHLCILLDELTITEIETTLIFEIRISFEFNFTVEHL